MVMVRVPKEASPFVYDFNDTALYAYLLEKDNPLVHELVIKVPCTTDDDDGNVVEIVNTLMVAANCKNNTMYKKTQLQRLSFESASPIKAFRISYAELLGELKDDAPARVQEAHTDRLL
jgi:hypothetical protein